ncbi:hypothetical protein WJX79_003791 [Trebouxia sp. C0005]
MNPALQVRAWRGSALPEDTQRLKRAFCTPSARLRAQSVDFCPTLQIHFWCTTLTPYKVHAISLSKNEQKEEWFLKINPNGRIPAIVDHDEGDLPVFESGAIMIYLADKDPSSKFLPKDTRKRAEVISWLMFQMGGLGPMQGQANHFVRYAPEKIEYGVKRYTNETRRLYGVIEKHLSDGRDWLAAGQYTIADMANFSWVFMHEWAGIEVDDMPHLKAWMKRIEERPAVQKGLDIPEENVKKQMARDPKKKEELIEGAKKMMISHK